MGQSPAQVVRGRVSDADTQAPLHAAHLMLIRSDTLRAFTDEQGRYTFREVPVGRYRLQASFLGYESITLAEVLVEAGKEVVLDVPLRERGEALQEVVVKSVGMGSAEVHPVSAYTITVEEQLRFPATYFDPARVALSYPGVAGMNDGTNIISVRGNSPSTVKWWLEGVEIVNPNHTANAGTFSDRPTQAGGGVNILSAQLLGASHFLTGAFPASYGNALGAILDMRLRRGNDQQHEFTAQAGLIGIDLAAEGPIKKNGASYMANYRYSFVGLLTEMGIDFGGEQTAFQDFSFHLSLPTSKAGHFSIFGIGGKSYTLFDSPGDTLVREDKQRFNIDFQSKMGAAGITHVATLGKKSVWRTTAVVSALEHERAAELVWQQPALVAWDGDTLAQRKISVSSVFSSRIHPRQTIRTGVQISQEHARISSFFTSNEGSSFFLGKMNGWLLQPFFDWEARFNAQWTLKAGFRLSHFTRIADEPATEPRFTLIWTPDTRRRISLSYGLLAQLPSPEAFTAPDILGEGPDFAGAHHLVAGYRQELSPSLLLNAEVYYQNLFNVLTGAGRGNTFSTINLVEAYRLQEQTLAGSGRGRNYGLDLSLQKFILDKYYFIAAGSLYRSLYTSFDGVERPTRFDGRYLLNLTGGREFLKKKERKVIIRGINAHLLWLGGFRGAPVDVAESVVKGYTVYDESDGFPLRQEDYFRIDLRLYQKWNRAGRNSTLSIDLQNVTGRENFAFEFYDFVQEKVETKRQIGLIPIASWRLEF